MHFKCNRLIPLHYDSSWQRVERSLGMDDIPDLHYDRSALFEDALNPETDTDADKLKKAPRKTFYERRMLLRTMKLHPEPFFRNDKVYEDVKDFLFERRYRAGDLVFEQGNPGYHFYIIDSGDFDVIKDGVAIYRYHNKGTFGSRSLYRRTERVATIKAVTVGKLWELDCRSIRRYLARKSYLINTGELVEYKYCAVL